jgi:hypothetical protein
MTPGTSNPYRTRAGGANAKNHATFVIAGASLAGAEAAEANEIRTEFIASRRVGGCVFAGMNVGIWDVTGAVPQLIRGRGIADDRRLADRDVPLDSLLPIAASSAP